MKSYRLVAFKKNGEAHRLWQRLSLIDTTDDYYVFASLYPSITEKNGRTWSDEERTLYFCHRKKFFNVVVMFKKDNSIAYYVNIATPTSLLENNTYGYIDLDLDVKLLSDKTIKILDEEEFKENSVKFNYDSDLIEVARKTVDIVIEMIKNNDIVFNDENNRRILKSYEKERIRW